MNSVRYRFGRDRRIRSRADFLRAYKRGTRRRARGFTVIFFRTGEKTRLGISVVKRYGNAVQRNRIKRMFREAFRLEQWKVGEGLDVVVIPRDPDLGNADLALLRGELRRAASKIPAEGGTQ